MEEKPDLRQNWIARQKKTYVTKEILIFAQNLLIHIQLSAQIVNVLVKNCLIGSKISEPGVK